MSRTLTSAVSTELESTTVRPIYIAEPTFSSGTVRVWSGVGSLSWNGQTWLGTGAFGGVSEPEEVNDLEATNITFTLSGIPSAYLALVLADSYQGKTATLWLGFLDSSMAVIADPFQLFSGRLETATISENPGDTCSISISAESELSALNNSSEGRYTNEEQQRLYPGDKGLEFMAQIATQEINWGRPYGK